MLLLLWVGLSNFMDAIMYQFINALAKVIQKPKVSLARGPYSYVARGSAAVTICCLGMERDFMDCPSLRLFNSSL